MKVWKVVSIGLVLVLLPAYLFSQPTATKSAPPPPSTLGNLRLSLLEGDVQIKTVDTGEWVAASINLPLKEEDELWVPEAGRMEIQILPATYVRLDQYSSLAVMSVAKDSEQLYLTQGVAYINFNPGRGGMIQIDTPISSIQVYNSSVFRVDVTEKGDTDVSILSGTVYVESKAGKTTVNEGSVLSLRDTDAEMAPLGPADDWEAWNVERDKRVFFVRESGRYLPPELRAYGSDFDSNGKWVSVREYGQVWTPTVVVAGEWAPYRVGRWTWIGGDYVWVSHEPWGWAPYHYGRWAHTAEVGWFWVPPAAREVYWGPGYVGWVETPEYVAWVPLAPREVYYGYGYYGPHSVNLYTTKIDRVPPVYQNTHVERSVTIINHNIFVQGYRGGGPIRYTDTGFRGNPFRDHGIHVGRPLITPVRSTMVSIHREISINRRPPDRIRETNITRIRDTRTIVRDPGVSAFAPGKRTGDLRVTHKEGVGERRKDVGRGPGDKGYRDRGPIDKGGKVGGDRKVGADRGPGDKGYGGAGPDAKTGEGRGKVRTDRGPGDKSYGDRGPGDKEGRVGVDRKSRADRGPGDKGYGSAGPGGKTGGGGAKVRTDRGPGDKSQGDRGPGDKGGKVGVDRKAGADRGPGGAGAGGKTGGAGPKPGSPEPPK